MLEKKDRTKVEYKEAENYLLNFLSYLKDRNQWIDENPYKKKDEVNDKKPEKSEEVVK